MTLRLKQGLGMAVGVFLLGGALVWKYAMPVEQSKASHSPEEVARQFIEELTQFKVAQKRDNRDTFFFIGNTGLISQKSASDPYAAYLYDSLVLKIYLPQLRARLSTQNGGNATVRVEPDKAAPPRELVLIQEEGEWRVDMMATYANWNQITEAQARKQVEKRGALTLHDSP
jgi:hypothetical protein